MNLDEKNIIKYFDIILLADKKDSFFSIFKILIPKHFSSETTAEKEFIQKLRKELKEFSEFHGYFEWLPNGSCRLTEKGLAAKQKGGHLKYNKSLNKTPLSLYQKIYLPIFIVFGLIGAYGTYKTIFPDVSKSEHQTLKSDFEFLKKKYDSIVELTSQSKLKKLNDTLQTKNLTDLKTD